jgi:hypothetical protein
MENQEQVLHIAISPTGEVTFGNDITCVTLRHRPAPSCREPHANDLDEEQMRLLSEEIRLEAEKYGLHMEPMNFIPKASMDRLPDRPETIARLTLFGRIIHMLTHRSLTIRDDFDRSIVTWENIPDYPKYHQRLAALADWYVERKKK